MTSARHPILVTGASRGIGRAICLALCKAGWPTVAWARTMADLESLAQEARGAAPIVQRVDLTDARAVRDNLAVLRARGVRIGSVVLNAGAGRWRPITEQSPEDWQHTQRLNVEGNYHLLYELLADINSTPAGCILALLSDSALYPFAERTAYAASKAALKMLLESTRREVRRHGTRVVLLYPSRVDTYFQGSMSVAGPGSRQGALTAAEVADVAIFALSQPAHVELREIQLGSTSASYGPYEDMAAS